MKPILSIILICLLTGCSANIKLFSDTPDQHIISRANAYVGMSERKNRKELRSLINVDPVSTEWCAAFVNSILELENIEGSGTVHHNPLLARSFLSWGQTIPRNAIQPGDIVVFPRGSTGWQGHVGFYYGLTKEGNWVILSGNYNDKVSYAVFRPTYAIGIRRANKKSNP